MKIVISANGEELDAQASTVFGRCPFYCFVDTETMTIEAIQNPAMSASGGAGIQAAQYVVERGAQAVVTGNMGPNAYNVFQSTNVPIYFFGGGTVREAVEAFKAGRLSIAGGASAPANAGKGMGGGMDSATNRVGDTGIGQGRGMGMGRGMGRGRGMGMGRGGMGRGGMGRVSMPAMPPMNAPELTKEEEIESLKAQASELQQHLASLLEHIDQLEKED